MREKWKKHYKSIKQNKWSSGQKSCCNVVKEDLARYKAEKNTEKEKLKKTVPDVETSQRFLTDEYHESNERVNSLIDDNKKIHLENQRLNTDIKDLKTQLQQSKDELNLYSQ